MEARRQELGFCVVGTVIFQWCCKSETGAEGCRIFHFRKVAVGAAIKQGDDGIPVAVLCCGAGIAAL